ncbi:O-antigen polymerase [Actinobacillus indolicus]|nr:O-antigen polymerase [Actinobacillus indolicus]VTU07129.1 O-antigen polymerase [Actinobacillus indolicus]
MPTFLTRIETKHISFMLNILVSLFFITVLMFKKGYSYVPMTLGGISVIYLLLYIFKFKKKWVLDKNDKWLIFAFLAYFSTFVMSAIVHGDGFREVDNPSRVLLFIPIILLLTQLSRCIHFIFYAIPVGAITTGLLALIQKFYLGLPKPFPEIMSIQAGNVSISLASFSIVIAIYWGIQKQYRWMAISILSAVFGMLASALSGARGGWVGFPFVILAILFCYRHFLNKKLVIMSLSCAAILIIAVASIPRLGVMQRYTAAKTDITRYLEKGHKYTSLGARFDMWENAFLGIQEKPIFGWGSKGYIELKKQQVANKTMAKSTLRFNDTHNQYLDAFVKRGFLGFLGLILIILMPLHYFFRKMNSANLEIKSIAILGFIHIFSTMFYFLSQTFLAHNSGSIFYFFLVVIFYSLIKIKENSKS